MQRLWLADYPKSRVLRQDVLAILTEIAEVTSHFAMIATAVLSRRAATVEDLVIAQAVLRSVMIVPVVLFHLDVAVTLQQIAVL